MISNNSHSLVSRLVYLPLIIAPAVLIVVLTLGNASGGPIESFSFTVAVNVESDPGEHAEHIEMPSNIKLRVVTSNGNLLIDGPKGSAWVGVAGLGGSVIVDVFGSGTVAGFENVGVRFEGFFDPFDKFGNELTGTYTMGIQSDAANKLPGGEPIVYAIKQKPPPGTTNTPTMPGLEPPTNTPEPPAPTITPELTGALFLFTRLEHEMGEGLPGFEVNFYRGNGCVLANFISSGVTDSIGSVSLVGIPKGEELYSARVKPRLGWDVRVSIEIDDFDYLVENCYEGLRDRSTLFVPVFPVRNGDVNHDGTTNSLDATLLLQHVAGHFIQAEFETRYGRPNYLRGDVNQDGDHTSVDVALILQHDGGFLAVLPVGTPPATVTPVPTTQRTVTPTPTATPPMSQPPTDTPTSPPPPTATSTPTTGKISLLIAGGPSRPVKVYESDDCSGGANASLNISGSLSLSFSPGTYSVMAEDVEGSELAKVTVDGEQVTPLNACQEVDLDAGQKVAVTFAYQ